MSGSFKMILVMGLLYLLAGMAYAQAPEDRGGFDARMDPLIFVDPLSIELTLPPEIVALRELRIGNEGEPGSMLNYSIAIDDPYTAQDRSIAGSTLMPSPRDYVADEIILYTFTVFNDSEDYEWLDEITMTFPAGVTVLGSTNFVGGTHGDLISDHRLGEGAKITWFDANGPYGNIWHQESATAQVLLYFGGGDIGNIAIDYTISGDTYGETPHDLAGKMTLYAPGTEFIDLLSPNGGEVWAVGDSCQILWDSVGPIAEVGILLSRDGGDYWEWLAESIENNGQFDWIAAEPLSSQCIVKVSAMTGETWDASEAAFTIHRPITWIEMPVMSGAVPAGEMDYLSIEFMSLGLGVGEYEANLVISSDACPDITVPLLMIVSETTGSGTPPARFALESNYPNPFNPSTTIDFSLAETGTAALTIVDTAGRRLRVLASGKLSAGHHSLVWDGRDERGRLLPSGVYLYRLEMGGQRLTRKMLLLK